MDKLSPGLSALQVWMMISVGLYVVGGLSFLLGPNLLLENLNRLSQALFKDRFPLCPLSTEKFWLTLTNSMMLMLVVVCAFVAADVQAYLHLTTVVLASKAFSSGQYLYYFLREKRYFAYLIGFLTDGPLFLITLYFYLRAL